MSVNTEAKRLWISEREEFLIFILKQGEVGLMGEVGPPSLKGLQVSDMSHTALVLLKISFLLF